MVRAELVKVVEDPRGIKIYVNYKLNGVDIPTKETIDNKSVAPIWIGWWNILGKTDQQILEWIRKNVESQCDTYIKQAFKSTKSSDFIANKLNQYIGSTIDKQNAEVGLDLDNDGQIDKQYRVFDNGISEEIV